MEMSSSSSSNSLAWKGIDRAEAYTLAHLINLDSFSRRAGEEPYATADAAQRATCSRLFENRMTASWITSSNLPEDKAEMLQRLVLAGVAPEIPAGTLLTTQQRIAQCPWPDTTARHRILAFFLGCRSDPERATATRELRSGKVVQGEETLIKYKALFDSKFETSSLSSDSDYLHYFVEGLNDAMPKQLAPRLSLKAKIVEDGVGLSKAATLQLVQNQYERYMTAASNKGMSSFLINDKPQRAAALQGLSGETELHEVAAKQVAAVTQPLLDRVGSMELALQQQQAAQTTLEKKVEGIETSMERGFAAIMAKLDQPGGGGGRGGRGRGGGGDRGSGLNSDGTPKDDSKVKC